MTSGLPSTVCLIPCECSISLPCHLKSPHSLDNTNTFVWCMSDWTLGLSFVIEHCKLICKPWQSRANRQWVTLPHIQPWPIPLTPLPLLSLAHCQAWPVTRALSVGKLFGGRIPYQAHTDERNHLTDTLQSTTNDVEGRTRIRISIVPEKK